MGRAFGACGLSCANASRTDDAGDDGADRYDLDVRVFVPLLLILPVAACGDGGTAERLSSKETFDGIDVPTIGTVGDFPDPAHRTVVNVTRDGQIVIDGETIPSERLFDEMKRRGARTPGRIVQGTHRRLSDESVVFRADGELPWGAACRLVQVCAEAWVWRLSFAARCESGGPDGCIGFPLPEDRPVEDTPTVRERARLVTYDVSVKPGDGGSPADLFASIARRPATKTGKRVVGVDVDPRLPLRVALEAIVAAHRVGGVQLAIEFGPALRRPLSTLRLAEEVAALRLPASDYSIDVRGADAIDPSAKPFPSAARIRGPIDILTGSKACRIPAAELDDPAAPTKAK